VPLAKGAFVFSFSAKMEVAMPFQVFQAESKSILSKTTGFIAQAGFTHSLTPARNCTFGCTYCYVPTMGIYGGLKPEDWTHWGQFTTFKSNAPELLHRQLSADQVIYCSPLVDPYQPAEEAIEAMPRILDEVLARPPKTFVIQTRGPLILRDLARLVELSRYTALRVSFSLTTNREDIRKIYEPHCDTIACRIEAIRRLRDAGAMVITGHDPEMWRTIPQAPHRLTSERTPSIYLQTRGCRGLGARGVSTKSNASNMSLELVSREVRKGKPNTSSMNFTTDENSSC